MMKLSAREAKNLAKKLGLDVSDDGQTFYATDKDQTELYDFDNKKDRDSFVERNKEA